jgi:hypothetical protein
MQSKKTDSFIYDANFLNKDFYHELLHILGLEEVKQQSKIFIKRKRKKDRELGSFLENTLQNLERKRPERIENYKTYGQDDTERLENIALELCITWTNRILFLKLLEAQLLQYHKNEKKETRQKYKFLNSETIRDFVTLDDLFFGVLAKRPKDRRDFLKDFAHIPYLNSSLFEETLLESSSVLISQLSDNAKLTLYSKTILKDGNGIRRNGKETPLSYFFQFLDAYNFSSEGTEEIRKDKKTLINASVLGLIFEKINGYKDGSFYTPSFITMYMCRQTLRRAVVQKFSDEYKMEFESFEDLQEFIKPQYKSIDKIKNNKIFDSIKICDPAVGSGHFLVSALNELITIKSELGILADENGVGLPAGIRIENDELFAFETEEDFFEYQIGNKVSQTIQKTLFHEKQKLIENCLFGVDVNPNSVKICRLRLWIELLKNAYYTKESNYTELETLPNIDINIKTGNSLISRFDLDADISKALKKSKWSIDSYRIAVQTYRNATSKEQKYEMEQLIDTIKADFRSEVSKKDPKLVLLSKKAAELQTLLTQTSVFELSKTEQKAKDKNIEKLEKEVLELNQEIEDIKSSKIYQNAFEWRFEFPEVLDKNDNFIGFDVVIGNPPYVDYRMIGKETTDSINHFQTNFQSPRPNLYQYFIERGYQITKQRGYCCYINPNQFLSIDAGFGIRKLLVENTIIHFIDDVSNINVFDEASTYTVVWCFQKIKNGNYLIRISKCKNSKELGEQHLSVRKNEIISNGKYLIVASPYQWLILKIEKDKQKLKNFCEMFWGTSKSGYGKLKIKKDEYLKLNSKERQEYKPLLQTRDIKRYCIDWKEEYLIEDVFSDAVLKKFEEEEKLVVARLTLQLQAAIDTEQSFAGKSTVIHKINPAFSKKYILALLNSQLIDFWYKNYFENTHMSGGYIRFDIPYLQKTPIPTISLEEQQPLITLVEQILSLKKANPKADTSELESEIDDLVYELYGLNEEEIAVISEK